LYTPPPKIKKSELDRIGDRIRSGKFTEGDLESLEQWRASHSYLINTFQARLRSISKKVPGAVATRLKRRPTIVDKLGRESGMKLSRMHDVAGCRVVFQTIEELTEFRRKMHNTRAKHRLISDGDKYNYIAAPKNSGYRSIHDVYEYASYSPTGEAWNGLKIEVQYRTEAQHSWSTAVEAFDMALSSRAKFSQANQEILRWFRVTSEIIARGIESRFGALPHMNNEELLCEYAESEQQSRVFDTLKSISPSVRDDQFKEGKFILIYHYSKGELPQTPLEIVPYGTWSEGVNKYFQLEEQHAGSADVVLVRSNSIITVRNAFRNYFLDVSGFIGLLEKARRACAN
jgi:putative GTP pyrophosphokinase